MLEDPNTEKHSLCHVLSDLVRARMNAAPGWQATVDILAKNEVSTLLFGIKLDCCVFQTLGWCDTSSTGDMLCLSSVVFYVSIHGYHWVDLFPSMKLPSPKLKSKTRGVVNSWHFNLRWTTPLWSTDQQCSQMTNWLNGCYVNVRWSQIKFCYFMYLHDAGRGSHIIQRRPVFQQ